MPTDASNEDQPAWPDDAVEVGRVAGGWGVKGALKVQPYSAAPEALFSSKRWFLRLPPQRPGAAGLTRCLRIVTARAQGDAVVATADDVADRDAADALRGAQVYVSRASFPTPEQGEYYWVDLIGLDVVNREGIALGRVRGLLDLGPHAVLQVQPAAEDASEVLIPFVAAYVDDVDLSGRRIVVDWAVDD